MKAGDGPTPGLTEWTSPPPSFIPSAPPIPLGSPEPAGRSHVTRALHLLLLLIVANQLVGSQFMEPPLPGEDAQWPFVLHQWVGMGGFVVLALFWIWALIRDRSETSLARLVPWFSRAGWRDVLVDAQRTLGNLIALKATSHRGGAFASAIHGLGLLVASAMAATGAVYFLALAGAPAGALTIGLHKLLANVMWAYLIGHGAMAALHAVLGDGIFAHMFWPKKRKAGSIEFP